MPDYTLHQGDCLEVLRTFSDHSVDAVVTDPPYGLTSKRPGGRSEATRGAVMGGFMGLQWDSTIPSVEIWEQCLRILKPGGHLLAFAGTRTQHRMAVNIEDAGFEIRDIIAWVYGSGFPKSLDVSKAIDGKLITGRSDSTALRQVNETRPGQATVRPASTNGHHGFVGSADAGPSVKRDEPATAEAAQWDGWGTALKPALEPITLARKPFKGTVAANVLQHGTGGLNIDGCRIGDEERYNASAGNKPGGNSLNMSVVGMPQGAAGRSAVGRWPANLIHDGSDEVVGLFPDSNGSGPARTLKRGTREGEGWGMSDQLGQLRDAGTGSAARFFYCPKASKSERGKENNHPTVKPVELMRYLCRLVTQPGGLVLDPFAGSGTTGVAALLEGFNFVGIEREPEYVSIANQRLTEAGVEL